MTIRNTGRWRNHPIPRPLDPLLAAFAATDRLGLQLPGGARVARGPATDSPYGARGLSATAATTSSSGHGHPLPRLPADVMRPSWDRAFFAAAVAAVRRCHGGHPWPDATRLGTAVLIHVDDGIRRAAVNRTFAAPVRPAYRRFLRGPAVDSTTRASGAGCRQSRSLRAIGMGTAPRGSPHLGAPRRTGSQISSSDQP